MVHDERNEKIQHGQVHTLNDRRKFGNNFVDVLFRVFLSLWVLKTLVIVYLLACRTQQFEKHF